MTCLADQVRKLLLEDRLTVAQAAQRLRLDPGQVVRLMNEPRAQAPRGRTAKQNRKPTGASPGDDAPVAASREMSEAEQIGLLRKKVRGALLARFEEFPPAVLLRLWQLVEDPRLLESSQAETEDPLDLPTDLKQRIFSLLDEALAESSTAE
jgi:hypothetical protein